LAEKNEEMLSDWTLTCYEKYKSVTLYSKMPSV